MGGKKSDRALTSLVILTLFRSLHHSSSHPPRSPPVPFGGLRSEEAKEGGGDQPFPQVMVNDV